MLNLLDYSLYFNNKTKKMFKVQAMETFRFLEAGIVA